MYDKCPRNNKLEIFQGERRDEEDGDECVYLLHTNVSCSRGVAGSYYTVGCSEHLNLCLLVFIIPMSREAYYRCGFLLIA
jgi:hypothetical protein